MQMADEDLGSYFTLIYEVGIINQIGTAFLEARLPNGRSKQVWLTANGKKFRDEALAKLAPLFQQLAGRFSSSRAAALLPELAEFRIAIDQLRDEIT